MLFRNHYLKKLRKVYLFLNFFRFNKADKPAERRGRSRISENVTLRVSSMEKDKIFCHPYCCYVSLVSTSRTPETPHEVWFHGEYVERIISAISTCKNPFSPDALREAWRPLDSIAVSLVLIKRSHQSL